MTLGIETVIQLIIQAVTVTAVIATVRSNQHFMEEKLNNLEKKQDKHNSLIERMAVVEQSTKSAHHRVDHLEEKICHD